MTHLEKYKKLDHVPQPLFEELALLGLNQGNLLWGIDIFSGAAHKAFEINDQVGSGWYSVMRGDKPELC